MLKKIVSLIIIALMIFLINNCAWASFADFTDEEADKNAQEQINEQKNEHDVTHVKSSDNYLSSLQVEGYTLQPQFDKQTLEYTLKEEVKDNEINIKAIASNDKAKIKGTGKIKIENDKKEYRIEVLAENNSVRTYIIKLNANKQEEKPEIESEKVETNSNIEEKVLTKIENEDIEQQENAKNTDTNNKMDSMIIYIAIGAVAVLVLIFILKLSHTRKRGKH